MGKSMVDYSHWKTPIAGNPPTMPEDGLQHPHEKPKFEKKRKQNWIRTADGATLPGI